MEQDLHHVTGTSLERELKIRRLLAFHGTVEDIPDLALVFDGDEFRHEVLPRDLREAVARDGLCHFVPLVDHAVLVDPEDGRVGFADEELGLRHRVWVTGGWGNRGPRLKDYS